MASALERAARALLDRAGYTEYGPVVPKALASELARAVLMAVRDSCSEATLHDTILRVRVDAILNEKE